LSAPAPIALFIGGAHKAGTTALLSGLAQHPGLARHPQSELSFFVEDEEYRQGFESRAWRRYLPEGLERRGFVAKHVKLLYRRQAVERLQGHSPRTLLVFLLRHPVERARSAYWHARAQGREDLESLEAALEAEPARLAAGMPPWHDRAYVQNGLYARHLEGVLEVFPHEQVRLLLIDELRTDFVGVCRGLCTSLGLEADFTPVPSGANRARRARSPRLARGLSRLFESRAPWKRGLRAALPDRLALELRGALVRWNSRPFEPPAVDPGTRARLLERFAADTARLEGLLGRELPAWRR